VAADIRTVSESTSYSLVMEPQGQDRTFWHHVGANATVDGTDVSMEGLDLLHLGYPSLLPGLLRNGASPLSTLLQRARNAGVTTSVDLAVVDPNSETARMDWPALLRRIVAGADILTPSLDDLISVLKIDSGDDADLAELFADMLISWGAAVVVISAGPHGLVLRTADKRRLASGGKVLRQLPPSWADQAMRTPAIALDAIRTTNGAGDASTAAILYGLSRGMPPEQTLLLATACSATILSGRQPTPRDVITLAPKLADAMLSPVPVSPVLLPANQPAGRFYRGGDQIARFRLRGSAQPYTPEDWIGSTVCVRGESQTGLTVLPDGRLLRDAIAENPATWLGERHVERFGADPMLLVKLLDAGQRLPVHAHPDGAFASKHLGASHGKAEAWHILTGGVVHIGLKRDVPPNELLRLIREQDVESLLSLLHVVPVGPGDRVFVPAGVLHAVGEGVMLIEVQEPEDLSILLEWRDFAIDGAAAGHLGLGFPQALEAIDNHRLHPAVLSKLILRADVGDGLPSKADSYFRLNLIDIDGYGVLEPGFAILIGVEGRLDTGEEDVVQIVRGSTALVPAAAGAVRLRGRGRLVVARPPAAG
jgi:mannose-6-phosphate isomerase